MARSTRKHPRPERGPDHDPAHEAYLAKLQRDQTRIDCEGDDDEPEIQIDDSYGPAHLRDDAYYARNDAGEYSWM